MRSARGRIGLGVMGMNKEFSLVMADAVKHAFSVQGPFMPMLLPGGYQGERGNVNVNKRRAARKRFKLARRAQREW